MYDYMVLGQFLPAHLPSRQLPPPPDHPPPRKKNRSSWSKPSPGKATVHSVGFVSKTLRVQVPNNHILAY